MLSRLYALLLVLVAAWSSWTVFGLSGVLGCAIACTLALFIACSWSLVRYAV